MSNQIVVPRTAGELAGAVRNVIDRLQSVKDDLASQKASMDQIAASNDWDSLGTALGCTSAEAEAVYNLYGSVLAGPMVDSFLIQLLSRLQYAG